MGLSDLMGLQPIGEWLTVEVGNPANPTFFANVSFLFLFLAMAFYWVDLAFIESPKNNLGLSSKVCSQTKAVTLFGAWVGPRSTHEAYEAGTKSQRNVFGTHLVLAEGENQAPDFLLVPTSNASILSLARQNFGKFSLVLANLSLIILLCIRWKDSGHFPLSNLYESLMFLSWSCTSIHLFLIYSWSVGPTIKNNLGFPPSAVTLFGNASTPWFNAVGVKPSTDQAMPWFTAEGGKPTAVFEKLLGAVLAPFALFLNAFATFSLPTEMQSAGPLVPALQSNWLMMHVTVMIVSYAALILGSLLSIVFVIALNVNKVLGLVLVSTQSVETKAVDENLSKLTIPKPNKATVLGTSVGKDLGENNQKLYSSLDYLSYRIIGIGFPFLTIGILSGAVWANEAWGSYWSWDPKETWALLTWLIFAIYLHTRLTKGWEGEKPALIASFGFIVVWICYLGVNLLGEGLHSYGFFST